MHVCSGQQDSIKSIFLFRCAAAYIQIMSEIPVETQLAGWWNDTLFSDRPEKHLANFPQSALKYLVSNNKMWTLWKCVGFEIVATIAK